MKLMFLLIFSFLGFIALKLGSFKVFLSGELQNYPKVKHSQVTVASVLFVEVSSKVHYKKPC